MAEFKKGEFIKLNSDPRSFFIYEGIETTPYPQSYYKRYSVILHYDPFKYVKIGDEWEQRPNLSVATEDKPLERHIESNMDGSTYSCLSQSEKEEALRVLKTYGYIWDEENLTLKRSDGTVVKVIKSPKIEYLGDEVRPMKHNKRKLLSKVCSSLTRASSYYGSNYYPSQTMHGYDYPSREYYGSDEYWD